MCVCVCVCVCVLIIYGSMIFRAVFVPPGHIHVSHTGLTPSPIPRQSLVRLFSVVGMTLEDPLTTTSYVPSGEGNATSLTLRHLILEDGKAVPAGGLIYALGANVAIDQCVLRNGRVEGADWFSRYVVPKCRHANTRTSPQTYMHACVFSPIDLSQRQGGRDLFCIL